MSDNPYREIPRSENPYQAPMAQTILPPAGSAGGIWSDGNLLVVHKQSMLPPICVKTNEPAGKQIVRTFYWHSGFVYLLVFVHVIIYLVAALTIRKKHQLVVPLSIEAAAKRRNYILFGWMVALLGIAVVVYGIYLIATAQNNNTFLGLGVAFIVIGFLSLIAGIVLGSRAANILIPKKITDHASWFKGADPEYVRRFPIIPPYPMG